VHRFVPLEIYLLDYIVVLIVISLCIYLGVELKRVAAKKEYAYDEVDKDIVKELTAVKNWEFLSA